MVTTMLGPMLPLLTERWRISDFAAGYLFTAQFLSSLITAAASGILIQRFGYRWSLFCSLLLMAAGAAMLDQSSWKVGMTAVCIYGAGFGLSTPTGNLLIAELNPERRAAALNLVNFSWGVGAVGAPIAIAIFARMGHSGWIPYSIAAEALILANFAGSPRLANISAPQPPPTVSTENTTDAARKIYLGLVLCVLFFTYVGTEAAIGGWVATHAHRLTFGVGTFWALVPSIFWGSLLIGRATAPLLLRRMREANLAIAGLALALAGIVCALTAHAVASVALGSGLAGLGLSSIFPANLSLLADWFGSKAPRAGSFAFPSASLGGAILPWLVGAVSTYSGGLRRGLFVPVAGIALMLLLYVAHARSPRTKPL